MRVVVGRVGVGGSGDGGATTADVLALTLAGGELLKAARRIVPRSEARLVSPPGDHGPGTLHGVFHPAWSVPAQQEVRLSKKLVDIAERYADQGIGAAMWIGYVDGVLGRVLGFSSTPKSFVHLGRSKAQMEETINSEIDPSAFY